MWVHFSLVIKDKFLILASPISLFSLQCFQEFRRFIQLRCSVIPGKGRLQRKVCRGELLVVWRRKLQLGRTVQYKWKPLYAYITVRVYRTGYVSQVQSNTSAQNRLFLNSSVQYKCTEQYLSPEQYSTLQMYITGYFTPAGSRKDHCRQRDMDSVRGVLGVLGPGDAVILEHPDLMVEYSSECSSGEHKRLNGFKIRLLVILRANKDFLVTY